MFDIYARILYEAESSSGWGEHELDYILMLRQRELSVTPSPEEVRDTEWVARDHLQVSEASDWSMLFNQGFGYCCLLKASDWLVL